MREEKKTSLLDELTERAGCTYLSGLPKLAGTARLAACLAEIPPDRYPLDEWREAAAYITGSKGPPCDGEAEARSRLTQPRRFKNTEELVEGDTFPSAPGIYRGRE